MAMKTMGILAVALTTMTAVSAIDTVSLAEAGAARPAQPRNVASGGAAALDKTKDVRRELENKDKELQASDKNFDNHRRVDVQLKTSGQTETPR
jgi:Skp family chaperone for outer membrane proteins